MPACTSSRPGTSRRRIPIEPGHCAVRSGRVNYSTRFHAARIRRLTAHSAVQRRRCVSSGNRPPLAGKSPHRPTCNLTAKYTFAQGVQSRRPGGKRINILADLRNLPWARILECRRPAGHERSASPGYPVGMRCAQLAVECVHKTLTSPLAQSRNSDTAGQQDRIVVQRE